MLDRIRLFLLLVAVDDSVVLEGTGGGIRVCGLKPALLPIKGACEFHFDISHDDELIYRRWSRRVGVSARDLVDGNSALW